MAWKSLCSGDFRPRRCIFASVSLIGAQRARRAWRMACGMAHLTDVCAYAFILVTYGYVHSGDGSGVGTDKGISDTYGAFVSYVYFGNKHNFVALNKMPIPTDLILIVKY